MWIEILKDFCTAFLLVWLLLPITQTILSAPFDIAYHFYHWKGFMVAKRRLQPLSILLAVFFGLLVHGGLDYLSMLYYAPLNPPLRIDVIG